MTKDLAEILEKKYAFFNHQRFIEHDPIQIPHRFSLLQDKEIMGFWVAILSWGQRKTILNNAHLLIDLMDGRPFEFIMQHQEADLKRFEHFKHRTFQYTDTLYFIDFFKRHYSQHESLESAFLLNHDVQHENIKESLIAFHNYFFEPHYAPSRTRKHISTPARNSACKRICMFLRWFVRNDQQGVDFGLWKKILPSQLICPLDIHSQTSAEKLGLIEPGPANWKKAVELTNKLKEFDEKDPVKYDFSLYGMGIEAKTIWA
ncbi:TIGR02757 family protein [Aquirufa sp. ROCK2-A2]